MNKLVMLVVAVAASSAMGLQGQGDADSAATLPKSAGLLHRDRDGRLVVASGARINHEAGAADKLGSFFVGLGYAAPDFDSAALLLMRFLPGGTPDTGFGKAGRTVMPLLPLRNRNRATATAVLQDVTGRTVVVGWRDLPTALDANVHVIVAARYTATGALDTSFGDRGVVTTRVDETAATQAFAAALDGEGRLLVTGYSGGRKLRNSRGSFDDWVMRSILLRYTFKGVLDASFGDGGVASQVIGPDGRDVLLYDYQHVKTAGLTLDRQGRAVIAASSGEGPVLLMRYTQDGRLDATFGSAGTVRMPLADRSGISSLSWDADGRLLAVGTSASSMVMVRYSPDGVLDPSFGSGGMRTTPLVAGMRVSAALQERDGHILAVASGENGAQLLRHDRDGTPDARFGSGGTVHIAAGRRLATIAGLAIDDSGTPTVAAVSDNGIFLVRYTSEGPVELGVRPTTARP